MHILLAVTISPPDVKPDNSMLAMMSGMATVARLAIGEIAKASLVRPRAVPVYIAMWSTWFSAETLIRCSPFLTRHYMRKVLFLLLCTHSWVLLGTDENRSGAVKTAHPVGTSLQHTLVCGDSGSAS